MDFKDIFHYKDGRGMNDFFRLYIEPGLYFKRLKKYFDLFPTKQVRVNLFDDLVEDGPGFLQSNFNFLGVEENFLPIDYFSYTDLETKQEHHYFV